MARSQKDDPRFGDLQHHTWNFRSETTENNTSANIGDRNQATHLANPIPLNDNLYVNQNFAANDVYINKHHYMNVPSPESNKDDNIPINNIPNVNRQNNMQNYAMLDLGNGQLVRVYYDENNQRLMIPVTGQYELFNPNQGLRDMPVQSQPMSHMFTLNQDFMVNDNNNVHMAQPTTASQSSVFSKDNMNNQTSNVPTSSFLKEVLGNWEPTPSGTYSPFGQNFPLNHPDAPAMSLNHSPKLDHQFQPNIVPTPKPDNSSPKRSDPLAETRNKKRIVAEVKPMRPTYSDVLAKNNSKNNSPTEPARKTKIPNVEIKPTKNNGNKIEKPVTNVKHGEHEMKQKNDNKKMNITSSGSESGDVNVDEVEKRHKPNKKSKKRNENMSRKWSSLDDITKEEDNSFSQTENGSQFVYIEDQTVKTSNKKEKKNNESKSKSEKAPLLEDDFKIKDEDNSQYMFQENANDSMKCRKKKENRNYGHKSPKPNQEKKKVVQNKWKRNKPGYLGVVQGYAENWGGATWKALGWFFYLLSDICRMSAHLSFDLCTSVFTQTYVSSQAIWRSSKEWIYKLIDNKYLMYIDRKFGHTRFGFWRKLKWFKKEAESDNGDATKLNANIPLPATGEEAMKRLLACKGKDPYSILGVCTTCTDEEIKRYYKRQAFLVHPDKNQYPGAEEAFKILQHAFDLIGEPERREAYDRQTALESKHMEATWSELSQLLAQLHDKMEFAANTIRCTNCGRRHKRVLTDRPCYAARYCAMCKIRHSAKEGDIWAESSMMGLLVMYYACMDGAVYQITQWASCQKKNLKQLRPDCHLVQYRIVLGNKATATNESAQRPSAGHDPNLEEFLNNLYTKSGVPNNSTNNKPTPDTSEKKRRNKKTKA